MRKLADKFNYKDETVEELQKHFDAIRDFCKERELPFVVTVMHSSSEDGYEQYVSAGLYGEDRTPDAYAVLVEIVEKSLGAGMLLGMQYVLSETLPPILGTLANAAKQCDCEECTAARSAELDATDGSIH